MAEERYHFWQHIHYDVPDSLDDLKGTPNQVFSLPVTVYWGPWPQPFNMHDETSMLIAYAAIISRGSKAMMQTYLNKDKLVELWPHLAIDKRHIRPLWENKFPELTK